MSIFALPDFGTDIDNNVKINNNVVADNNTVVTTPEGPFLSKGRSPSIRRKIFKREDPSLALNAEMNVITSGDFDGKIELNDNLLEFDMAGSKNINAKRQKFLEQYPNGTLTPVQLSNGDVKLIYKKEENDPYRFVNRGVNYPEITRAIVSGDLIGGLIVSRFNPMFTGVGTGVGSLLEYGVETARGYETQTGEKELKEATLEGLVAGGLDFATRKLFSLYKKFKNAGNVKILDVADFADDVAKFAEEETLEPLIKGNVLKTPVWQSAFAQSQITSPSGLNTFNKQIKTLQKRFGSMGDSFDASAFTTEELSLIIKAQGDDLVQRLFSSTDINQPLSREWLQIGQNYQQGLKNWVINSRELKDGLYKEASNLTDDLVFDVTSLQTVAKNIKDVVRAKGVETQSQIVGTGLFDDLGNEITRVIPGKAGPVPLLDLSKDLRDVIETIGKMDPKVSMYQGFDPIDQLKTLRTSVFTLQQSDNATTKRYANQLYTSLKEVMESPLSGNTEFLDFYKKASAFNSYRENILNLSVIKKSLKSDTIEDIITSKFNIAQPSEVSYIKKVLDKKTFNMLKASYLQDIASNNSSLNKFLRNENQYADVVSEIFSKTEIDAIKKFALARQKLDISTLAKIIKKDVSNAERAYALIDEGYDVFKNILIQRGGKDGKFAQSIKAGIYKKIFDDSIVTTKTGGIDVLDVKKFMVNINKIENNTALKELLFSPEELSRLKKFNLYSSFIDTSDDVGGMIQKGQAGANIKSIGNVAAAKISVGNLYLSNAVLSKLMSIKYKPGTKLIINGAANSSLTSEFTLRWLALGLNALNRNITEEENKDLRLRRNTR